MMKIYLLVFMCGVMLFMQSDAGTPQSSGLSQHFHQMVQQITEKKDQAQSREQSLRDKAIARAALVYGAQSGLYYRWLDIQSLLFKRANLLSHVFNFGAMYLDHGLIQPPVLDSHSDVMKITDSGQMRTFIHHVYRVLTPATFMARPITWQVFLLPDRLSKPARPRMALLPKNAYEKKLWQYYLKKGWQQGIQGANSEFDTRLSSLNSAYQGMVLYTLFAMRGMIAPPQVVGFSQDADHNSDGRKMAVGIEQSIMTKNSYFIAKPNHWRAVFYRKPFSAKGD